jgi:spore germination protein YaaH
VIPASTRPARPSHRPPRRFRVRRRTLGGLRRLGVAALAIALVLASCDAAVVPVGSVPATNVVMSAGAGSVVPPAGSAAIGPGGGASTEPLAGTGGSSRPLDPIPSDAGSAAPSGAASASASARPTADPALGYDPAKFGFAGKGLRGEVMAFVTTSQVDDALARLDFAAVSTIAFFSLEAGSSGELRHDGRWTIWQSPAVDQLIARAHATATKVVVSIARFSWSGSQTAVSATLLRHAAARARLAREIVDEVVRRGIDGVNIDVEPVPVGARAAFTDLIRRVRAELDARRSGSQLTFDVTGHFESYDVGGALRAGADAVYLMGYHFAGTFSTVAHATAPLGGRWYAVSDAIRLLKAVARPKQLIVGLPFYGHLWPTKTAALNAPVAGRGFDVTYDKARTVARLHPASYDAAEQVRRVVWQERSCSTCALHWVQLYFDDARSLAAKWAEIRRQDLLGTGIWTTAFEGPSGDLTAALRRSWLAEP